MDTRILKEIIALIRTEQERRSLSLKDQDYAYDHWIFWDEPFLNELCLMFLVTLRHQIEREIVGLAARTADGGREISDQQHKERLKQLRRGKDDWDWGKIKQRLTQWSCDKWNKLDVLRLLSNSYKHDLLTKPGRELLDKLQLNPELPYAPLPESCEFRNGLAKFIGLDEEKADYCDIAESFVDIANEFLAEVQSCTKLSKVKWGRVSLKPSNFEG